ncbi:MAG: porphobilinogen synthase [Kiritimatiellae bacterium]|jgi:porphobilinogen synthase|nr:porphobilinogen synthase [Kiritimatiellia bacterium]
MTYPIPHRNRRLRSSAPNRGLQRETRLHPDQLIYPMFLCAGLAQQQPIPTLPGQFRWSADLLVERCAENQKLGVHTVNLFGTAAAKSPEGEAALDPDGMVPNAIRALKRHLPDLNVQSDLALDPYTTHGHDGLLIRGRVDNDATVDMLQKMALVHAEAGVDWVAPSDMMDGRVGAIRHFLDMHGHIHVNILAYTAKYASCFYGPFRCALETAPLGGEGGLPNKKTYQMDPANRREALKEGRFDLAEGADALMVKPASHYLDVIMALKHNTDLPIAAYQVSGEYAMMHAASEKGWLDLDAAMEESLLCIRRAGADMILTYFAPEMARKLTSTANS